MKTAYELCGGHQTSREETTTLKRFIRCVQMLHVRNILQE